MKGLLFVLLVLLKLGISAQITKYAPKDMETWQSIGMGNGFVTHGQFFMEEIESSRGFMLLSPEKYNDVVLRYEVMTLNTATVLVTILNASDIGESAECTLTTDSDNFGFWTKKMENYMFAFRVQAHNSTPFLRKHPVKDGIDSQIALAPKDVMHSGWRHKVECGKQDGQLWLKIDNEIVFDVKDNNPLSAGRIAIRVRGTANELGKCMIRNLEIEGKAVK